MVEDLKWIGEEIEYCSIIVFIIGGIVVFYNHNNKVNCSKDALKFKQNYEKYNGNMIKYNNKSYKLRNVRSLPTYFSIY